jgi:hypothetical protein
MALHDSRPARLADPVAAALNSATAAPPLDPQPGSKVVSSAQVQRHYQSVVAHDIHLKISNATVARENRSRAARTSRQFTALIGIRP